MKGFAVRGGAVIRGIVAVVALLGALRLPAAAVAQEVPAEAGAAGEADTRPPLHVLFIGNSLTYVNDLPAVFAALAEAAGRARPFVRAVTGPGLSLEDQWNRGDAQKAIAVGGWDYVVLQQGPSASSEGVTVLLLEHNMRVLMSVSHDILVLNFGRRIAEGGPAEVRVLPEVIEAYLGTEVIHDEGMRA